MRNASLFCREMGINQRRKELLLKTDRLVDDLYYLKDILCVGESRLSNVVTQNVINLLLFPILHPLLQLRQSGVRCLSSNSFGLFCFSELINQFLTSFKINLSCVSVYVCMLVFL